jgi:hypothetical protein
VAVFHRHRRHTDETDRKAPAFGPRAVWLATWSLMGGWLVIGGLRVADVISAGRAAVWCLLVVGAVGFGAYMWATRRARQEFAERVAQAEQIRHNLRPGHL